MSQPNTDTDTHIQLNQNDANVENFINQMKQHEQNIEFLNSPMNRSTESVLDLQVSLERYYSSTEENSVASLFYWIKANTRTSNLAFVKDALGVVATLASVENDDLSR
ncbi:protein DEFECTIVE IN MERISTEM SILENCING 3-like [Vicia villosa]|uniref:protein DEFECTIVE IN MERISTEM SILENCING 3-like n=1 Tax=Vicia villosa TaxID=3911 RepID=UPI00273B2D33|nr:protein DEFECTIVE IN MERISTEM SILENCING 3-like [Vicia villosa]